MPTVMCVSGCNQYFILEKDNGTCYYCLKVKHVDVYKYLTSVVMQVCEECVDQMQGCPICNPKDLMAKL